MVIAGPAFPNGSPLQDGMVGVKNRVNPGENYIEKKLNDGESGIDRRLRVAALRQVRTNSGFSTNG